MAYFKPFRGHSPAATVEISRLSERQWRREHPGTEIVVAFGRDRLGQQLANAASDLVIDAAGPPPPRREPPTVGCRWSEHMHLEHLHRQSRGLSRSARER
jgi:hypothetical protein